MNPEVTMNVKITLLEEMLGMTPANPDIQRDYIASKAPNAASIKEELESTSVEDYVEKTMTIFPRLGEEFGEDAGAPFIWDYQIKGWIKDAWSMIRRMSTKTECGKITVHKKKIDGLIFPQPRKIKIALPEGKTIGNSQRPLRAQTPQGERVSLVNSETVPAGSVIEFKIALFDKSLANPIIECLDYGEFRGLGQWRNSGKGIFKYEYPTSKK